MRALEVGQKVNFFRHYHRRRHRRYNCVILFFSFSGTGKFQLQLPTKTLTLTSCLNAKVDQQSRLILILISSQYLILLTISAIKTNWPTFRNALFRGEEKIVLVSLLISPHLLGQLTQLNSPYNLIGNEYKKQD